MNRLTEKLILVDEHDNELGALDKLSVHEQGILHRAFSVFIFNSKGELLLQKRASQKYHSPGLWSNTCCSHPNMGEATEAAVKRRLWEEMGMRCNTTFTFSFIYKAEFDNGLKEHEYDYVYTGTTDTLPNPDASEVMEWKYITLNDLQAGIDKAPGEYTAWLKICLPKLVYYLRTTNGIYVN